MKSKVKIKDSLLVMVKLSFHEAINLRECELFGGKGMKGFLKIKASKKNKLEYTGPVAVALKERLKKPVSKKDFLLLMAQIVEATRKLQNNNLPLYKLNRDFNSIYINETTKELYFMYMPIEMPYQKVDELDFISSIVYTVMPEQEEDRDFLPQFNYFIRNMQEYNPDILEAYISSIDKRVMDMLGARNREQSGFITNKPQEYLEHYGNTSRNEVDYEKTGLLIEEERTGLLMEDAEDATGLLIDEQDTMETGLLVEENETADGALETGLLVEEEEARPYFPILHRVLTNQDIVINKPVFRIGKEKSYVDFFVMNNDAISRSHADIITRGNHYYVKDLNSKNRSFINNRVLPVQFEVEIFDGDTLKLANEEFVFHA